MSSAVARAGWRYLLQACFPLPTRLAHTDAVWLTSAMRTTARRTVLVLTLQSIEALIAQAVTGALRTGAASAAHIPVLILLALASGCRVTGGNATVLALPAREALTLIVLVAASVLVAAIGASLERVHLDAAITTSEVFGAQTGTVLAEPVLAAVVGTRAQCTRGTRAPRLTEAGTVATHTCIGAVTGAQLLITLLPRPSRRAFAVATRNDAVAGVAVATLLAIQFIQINGAEFTLPARLAVALLLGNGALTMPVASHVFRAILLLACGATEAGAAHALGVLAVTVGGALGVAHFEATVLSRPTVCTLAQKFVALAMPAAGPLLTTERSAAVQSSKTRVARTRTVQALAVTGASRRASTQLNAACRSRVAGVAATDAFREVALAAAAAATALGAGAVGDETLTPRPSEVARAVACLAIAHTTLIAVARAALLRTVGTHVPNVAIALAAGGVAVAVTAARVGAHLNGATGAVEAGCTEAGAVQALAAILARRGARLLVTGWAAVPRLACALLGVNGAVAIASTQTIL